MKTFKGEVVVDVVLVGNRFHLAPANEKFQFYPRQRIPKWLWEMYLESNTKTIDLYRTIMHKFKPVLDKKMHVAKYHPDDED